MDRDRLLPFDLERAGLAQASLAFWGSQMPLLPETPIRFLKRLFWWLLVIVRWLWEGKRFWLPVLAPVLVWALVVAVTPCVERQVRLTGMLLQLLGVITIAMRLRATQRQFPGQTLARWFQRRPRFRVQNTITGAAGASLGMATASARGRVSPGPQATLEQRVAMLEDSYTRLFDEVGNLGSEVRRRTDESSSNLRAETAFREAGDKRVEEQLMETAVGGLHLDFWGVLFFILGIIAGTASPEIAAALGAAPCN
jgi:hypothetical protein